MKIAVVTVYDGNNYGSFLQAYAMKIYLEQRGHSVSFVERVSEEENFKYFYTRRFYKDRGCFLNAIAYIKRCIFNPSDKKKREYIRDEYDYLRNARRLLTKISTKDLTDVDLIICGSDEIWNVHNVSLDVLFYLCNNFGDGIRKIAVAVSSGISKIEDYSNNREIIKSIQKFDAILVRDRATKELVEYFYNKKLEYVCDPTLYIDKSFYLTETYFGHLGDFILIYAYKFTKKEIKAIKKYAKENHLRIISTGNYLDFADINLTISPFDFGKIISSAKGCITSTFHGTIFCAMFAKHFCYVPRLPKISDVADKLLINCQEWKGGSYKDLLFLMEQKINHKKIDEQISLLRMESVSVINEVIEK